MERQQLVLFSIAVEIKTKDALKVGVCWAAVPQTTQN
jgi:hypothetical protein